MGPVKPPTSQVCVQTKEEGGRSLPRSRFQEAQRRERERERRDRKDREEEQERRRSQEMRGVGDASETSSTRSPPLPPFLGWQAIHLRQAGESSSSFSAGADEEINHSRGTRKEREREELEEASLSGFLLSWKKSCLSRLPTS